MSTNPLRNSLPAVSYRVGSGGPQQYVADIPSESIYDMHTIPGIEWYDDAGNWTDSPGFEPCSPAAIAFRARLGLDVRSQRW